MAPGLSRILRSIAIGGGMMLVATACAAPTASPSPTAAASPAPSQGSGETPTPTAELPAILAECQANPGELEVVSFYPEGAPSYETLKADAAKFEEACPGSNVTLTFGGGQDTPKIQARWRAGQPPEVNVGFFSGTAPSSWAYVEAGQVYSLTDAMTNPLDGYSTTWGESILPAVRPFIVYPKDQGIYSVPSEVTTIQFFYNKKLFAANGLEAPETWTEFLAASAKLKEAGVAPLAVTGTFAGYMQLYFDYLLLRTSGAAAVQGALANTRSFAELPGVDQAAEALETLVTNDYFADGFEGTDFTSAQLQFFQGDTAMILMGSWLVQEMKDSIPADFEIGTFPFPTVEGGQGDATALFGTVNNLTVAAQSKRPDLGAAFLYLSAGKDAQEGRVKDLGLISPYAGVSAPAGYEGVVESLARDGAFVPSYWNLYASVQANRDAYQLPVTKLFFGQIDAKQLVEEIDSNISAANQP